jgi:hypothetical protein
MKYGSSSSIGAMHGVRGCQAGAALALWRGEPLADAGSELPRT